MIELLKTCEECLAHYSANTNLLKYCESVGEEYGYSTDVMLSRYLNDYHKESHYERLESSRS